MTTDYTSQRCITCRDSGNDFVEKVTVLCKQTNTTFSEEYSFN